MLIAVQHALWHVMQTEKEHELAKLEETAPIVKQDSHRDLYYDDPLTCAVLNSLHSQRGNAINAKLIRVEGDFSNLHYSLFNNDQNLTSIIRNKQNPRAPPII
jgi:hypothetical protein